MKKRFRLEIQSLQDIFGFIEAFSSSTKLDQKIHYDLDLGLEELFTNMVKYNQKQNGEVEIDLEVSGKDLIISITDFNVPPFDITKSKKYDTEMDLEKRPVGKLGIHLIKIMMDKIEYRYENNNNIITLIKHMGKSNV